MANLSQVSLGPKVMIFVWFWLEKKIFFLE
jgi:hypothetical protein